MEQGIGQRQPLVNWAICPVAPCPSPHRHHPASAICSPGSRRCLFNHLSLPRETTMPPAACKPDSDSVGVATRSLCLLSVKWHHHKGQDLCEHQCLCAQCWSLLMCVLLVKGRVANGEMFKDCKVQIPVSHSHALTSRSEAGRLWRMLLVLKVASHPQIRPEWV